MSHLALRRVMVRMLHDPQLTAAVYADPARALAGLDVSPVERGWLVAAPPGAWRTDPERPARVLAALLDEFPAAAGRAPGRAARFFSSAPFHRAVQERGSLALAFGEHLAGDPDPIVGDLARLETAIARVRRAPRRPRPSPAGRLRCTPAAAVVRVAGGTLARYEAIRRGDTGAPPRAGDACVLVVRTGADSAVRAEEIPRALAGLLEAAAHARPHASLLATARRLGADPGEEAGIVAGLVDEGLLV